MARNGDGFDWLALGAKTVLPRGPEKSFYSGYSCDAACADNSGGLFCLPRFSMLHT
jgi:hypothetical protein